MSLRRQRRTSVLAALAAAGTLILGACGDENGQAIPGETIPPATSDPTSGPSTPAPGGGGLAQVNACDLLTDDEAATISKGLEKEDLGAMAGATSACEWNTSIDRGVPLEDGITFGISIQPSQSVDEVSVRGDAKVTDGDVKGRTAKQVAENDGNPGSCLLSFAAENGRVDLGAESYGDTERSCTAVDKVSTIIESKLPKA